MSDPTPQSPKPSKKQQKALLKDPYLFPPPEPELLSSLERRTCIVEMRKAGWTLEQIAVALDMPRRLVYRALKRHIIHAGKRLMNSAKELYALEYERLEAANRALWPKAMSGDWKSMDLLLRLMERRARMLGLDAPVKVQQQVDMTLEQYSDAELLVKAQELGICLPQNLPQGLPALLPGEVSPDGDPVLQSPGPHLVPGDQPAPEPASGNGPGHSGSPEPALPEPGSVEVPGHDL